MILPNIWKNKKCSKPPTRDRKKTEKVQLTIWSSNVAMDFSWFSLFCLIFHDVSIETSISGSCLSQLLPLSTRGYHGILLFYVSGGCQLSCYNMIQHVDAQTRNLGKTSGKHHPGHLGTTLGATNNWEWPTTISTYGQQNITASRGGDQQKGRLWPTKIRAHRQHEGSCSAACLLQSWQTELYKIVYSQTVLSP